MSEVTDLHNTVWSL